MIRSARVVLGVVAGLAGIGLISAARSTASPPTAPSARPIPAATFNRIASTNRADLLSYADKLTFDTSYDATDVRQLMRRENGKLVDGPVATLAPEIGSVTTTYEALGQGRIIARVTTDRADVARGLGKGDNFIWVEAARTSDGSYRAFVVSRDPDVKPQSYRFVQRHVMSASRTPEAKFRWTLGGEDLWIRCDAGCCMIETSGSTRPRPRGSN